MNITGSYDVGGLVGRNTTSSTVNNCCSTGSVSGDTGVGGLVGHNVSSSMVNSSYSTVNVGATNYVSGLVGYNSQSSVVNSRYSTGNVGGNHGVGGLVGYNHNSEVNICYSTSQITGNSSVGGLVGINSVSTVNGCYSTGHISGNLGVGGLLGYSDGTVTNSFWDTETSETSSSADGTGKTTDEMKNVATFTNISTSAGLTTAWDFVTNPNDDAANNNYWDMDQVGNVNNGYPILSWQAGADGSLPVELSIFTATRKGNNMLLSWVTESEIQNLGFILERSENGAAWHEIASFKDTPSLTGQGSVSKRTEYSYTDANILNGVEYNYRLADVSYKGDVQYHALGSEVVDPYNSLLPSDFRVHKNYPNPFNPNTVIAWEQGSANRVVLAIYDVNGRLVRELVNSYQSAGYHEAIWAGRDAFGDIVPAGLYVYRVSSAQQTHTQKMLLLK